MTARDYGLFGGIGIGNVKREHLMRALEITEIVCVQDFFNLAARQGTPILDECNARDIAFVPFCPLGRPRTQREAILSNRVVARIADAHDASAPQVALAWLLATAPNVLLIPGTRMRAHVAENLAAGDVWLDDREMGRLNREFD